MKQTQTMPKRYTSIWQNIVYAYRLLFQSSPIAILAVPAMVALSVLLPPIPGLMIAQHYFVPLSKEGKSINWVAILAWVLGSTIGFIALQTNFLVPAMVSMACTFVLYILLSRVLDKTWNRDICGEK